MRTAVIVICCCLGLAACTVAPTFKPDTSVTRPAVGRPAPPSSVQAASASDPFTPYQNLGQSADDGLAPGESFSAISKACLTDEGFPDAVGGFGFIIIGGPFGDRVPWGPWGYLGTAEAAQEGFSFQGAYGSGVIHPVPQGPPSAAERKAMNKCGTITAKFDQSQFTGTLAGITALTNDIITDVQHDPSVRAATKAWSACMAQNGYNITDPQTAIRTAFGGSAGAAKGAIVIGGTQNKAQQEAQIALAVTDADCTASTDLAGIYFAVQASYEQQLVTANQQALNAATQQFRTAYQKELTQLPKLLNIPKAGLPASARQGSSRRTSQRGLPPRRPAVWRTRLNPCASKSWTVPT